MGAVYFYHLTQSPLDETLTSLLTKALGAGWRVAVRGVDGARMDALDQALWRGDGFLPHGLAGGAQDADQPVLLTTSQAAANDPQCIMAVDGAEVEAEEITASERVCVLFNGHDDAAVEAARGQWKALTDAGCAAQYWSDSGGRWEKKAER